MSGFSTARPFYMSWLSVTQCRWFYRPVRFICLVYQSPNVGGFTGLFVLYVRIINHPMSVVLPACSFYMSGLSITQCRWFYRPVRFICLDYQSPNVGGFTGLFVLYVRIINHPMSVVLSACSFYMSGLSITQCRWFSLVVSLHMSWLSVLLSRYILIITASDDKHQY